VQVMNEDAKLDEIIKKVRQITRNERISITRPDLTRAAVLVPIVLRNGEPHLIVTKRTMTVATHKGQISFPGGVREPEDRDEVANALRESQEEIGLEEHDVEVLGLLDDFATTTGFSVTPVVGLVATGATYQADKTEVAEIIETPFSVFLDPDAHELVTMEQEGFSYRFHKYKFKEHVIWGATAGIIHRFMTALYGGE
jgi:8-oxo-dGTP pyrophosphatase MutT (NUDIX family)